MSDNIFTVPVDGWKSKILDDGRVLIDHPDSSRHVFRVFQGSMSYPFETFLLAIERPELMDRLGGQIRFWPTIPQKWGIYPNAVTPRFLVIEVVQGPQLVLERQLPHSKNLNVVLSRMKRVAGIPPRGKDKEIRDGKRSREAWWQVPGGRQVVAHPGRSGARPFARHDPAQDLAAGRSALGEVS